MRGGPHQVTKDFEQALCDYTGATYAVAVNSCSMALLLAVAWHLRQPTYYVAEADGPAERPRIEIPRRTYCSVPMAIMHAGGKPVFRDEEWYGAYKLSPLPVWDFARLFTSGMYAGYGSDGLHAKHREHFGEMLCVSFHASKTLGLEQGGAILHDDPKADMWLRRARFDGRQEGVAPLDQKEWQVGWHCYMSPSVAAQGILKLYSLPKHNQPLPNDPYPRLDLLEIFKCATAT